jgi:hypothetical protein
LSNKAFKIYLKMSLKNKRHNLKVQIESWKERPKTCTPMHWENMKAMIYNPSKVEAVVELKVVRGCQQNPSRSRHVKDEIGTRLVRFFFAWGWLCALRKFITLN